MPLRTLLFAVTACFVSSDLLAAPVLDEELTDSVREVIERHFPGADVIQDDSAFSAKFGTKLFTVHGQSKTGEFSEDVHAEEGPNFRGFMLSIVIRKGAYEGAAVVPQTLNRPYWKTFIARPETADGQGHYAVDFSFGSRLDQDFRNDVLKWIRSISSPSENGDTRPHGLTATSGQDELDTLEGVLRVHPKFHYRFYLEGFGDGQSAALFEADEKLKSIPPGTRFRVQGTLRSTQFGGDPADSRSALVRTWVVYMNVNDVEAIK